MQRLRGRGGWARSAGASALRKGATPPVAASREARHALLALVFCIGAVLGGVFGLLLGAFIGGNLATDTELFGLRGYGYSRSRTGACHRGFRRTAPDAQQAPAGLERADQGAIKTGA